MLQSLLHIAVDPVLDLAYLIIRILMISLPILTALFILTFFADIFYYFLMNSGF
jgi:hypothetical protein